MTAEQAVWKPDGVDNSIWEILSHLNYYNFAYLQRFKGFDYKYTKADNNETFEHAEGATETNWKTEIERFNSIMNEWSSLLSLASDSKFDEAVSAENESLWRSVIANINVHNAHHGGQILLLRKLQGSWDSNKGIS